LTPYSALNGIGEPQPRQSSQFRYDMEWQLSHAAFARCHEVRTPDYSGTQAGIGPCPATERWLESRYSSTDRDTHPDPVVP